MSWEDGAEDRAESLRRIKESAAQSRYDFKRGWKIYRRSLLAVIGLLMVISISVVSIFADDIAVEHPGRNLQDTRFRSPAWSVAIRPEPGSVAVDALNNVVWTHLGREVGRHWSQCWPAGSG